MTRNISSDSITGELLRNLKNINLDTIIISLFCDRNTYLFDIRIFYDYYQHQDKTEYRYWYNKIKDTKSDFLHVRHVTGAVKRILFSE